VAIVTGGNSGIGFQTVKALMNWDGTVIIACRDKDKSNEAILNIMLERFGGRGVGYFSEIAT